MKWYLTDNEMIFNFEKLKFPQKFGIKTEQTEWSE